MEEKKVPLIIYDTDMDTDCDDAGAFAIIAEYVKRGKAQLYGIIADAAFDAVAPACEALCRFYGLDAPIGAIYPGQYPAEETDRLVRCREHNVRVPDRMRYNRVLAARLGKSSADYPAAVETYRKLLANAEDKSVTIIAVGFLTALSDLLDTGADETSELSGIELVEKKVDKIVIMGDYLPTRDKIGFNWKMDAKGAANFFNKCPVSCYLSEEGDHIVSGEVFSEKLPEGHILREIYEIYNGVGKGRRSWDLIATLYALDNACPYVSAEPCRTCRYDSVEITAYYEDGERQDYHVFTTIPNEEMAQKLNEYMLGEF